MTTTSSSTILASTNQPPPPLFEGAGTHPEFYFDDGNLIMAVGTEGKPPVLFRVFKSQLAKHSQVFSDMLSMPPPTAETSPEQEVMDGCQVVRLQDSPEDMACMLDLMWNIQRPDPSLDYVLGVLRISTKYIFSAAREWSLSALRSIFPTDRSELLDRSRHLNQWRTNGTATRLILVADQCDTPEFLPFAFFALATEDWTSPTRLSDIQLSSLRHDQLIALSAGRAVLQHRLGMMMFTQETVDWDHGPKICTKDFEQGRACQSFYGRSWRSSKTDAERYLRLADPTLWLNDERDRQVGRTAHAFCNACAAAWAIQSDRKVYEVFDQFCAAVWPLGLP